METQGREGEEKVKVLREEMDEFDSGGQAPLPDDEGNTPPLPEKVSTLLFLFFLQSRFLLLSLALCLMSLIRRKLLTLGI